MSEEEVKLPPEVKAASMKILEASLVGTVQLIAPEAEWIRNAVGMTLAQMQQARNAGKVMLAQQREFDAQFHGMGVLYNKVDRAFKELLKLEHATEKKDAPLF